MKKSNRLQNQSGFVAAEFLFAFTMVIGCGILIFGLTFTLMTIEVAQYIVWSSARSYAVGNTTKIAAIAAGKTKYKNLTAEFPLLTGNGNDSPWFKMSSDTELKTDDQLNASFQATDPTFNPNNTAGSDAQVRHPWLGVESEIDLLLLKGIQLPFLGKIAANPSDFKFKVRGILLRHPSQQECLNFYLKENRFDQGIKQIKVEQPAWANLSTDADSYAPIEDNGC